MRPFLFLTLSAAFLFSLSGNAAQYAAKGVRLPQPPTNDPLAPTDSKIDKDQFVKTVDARLKQWESLIPQVEQVAEKQTDPKKKKAVADLVAFLEARDKNARRLLPQVPSAGKDTYKQLQQRILAEVDTMLGHYQEFRTAE